MAQERAGQTNEKEGHGGGGVAWTNEKEGHGGGGVASLSGSAEDLSVSTRSGSPRYNSTLIDEK